MTQKSDKKSISNPPSRADFSIFRTISTRWLDNDVYGHVNNVVYYSWFDTAVNAFLIEQGALDIHHGSVIGLVVESHCNYFAPLVFPQNVEAGLSVTHIGRSSVRYEIALFASDSQNAAASGYLVHVYVDKVTRRPVPIPESLRDVIQSITSKVPS
jgi:acyl-CoA thioester hydrolase